MEGDRGVDGGDALPLVRRRQPLLDDVAGQLDAARVERRTPLQRHASARDVSDLE